MQTRALLLRRSVAVTIAIGLLETQLSASDLPVKRIILYKHGIAYFEREGPAPEQVRLDFKSAEMNDVLKSLMVADSSGGRISAIRYDSNETLDQRLEHYPFRIGNQELLSTFLDNLKGTRVELKVGERTATGSIMAARSIQTDGNADGRGLREQLTLLLDSGDVASYDLGTVSSLRFLDTRFEEQLKQYLETVAETKSRDRRSLYIDLPERSNRSLRISYITPAAIWKSSYRLSLDDPKSILEGWAIVDNTTDDDWNNVKLSVVSGRPISFISLLDTPRYGRREVAELPEDRAAGPVVYGGNVDVESATRLTGKVGTGSGNGYGPGSGGGVGGGTFIVNNGTRLGTGNPSAGLQPKAFTQSAELQANSSVEGAAGATLGELFEYNFATPVTIKKNQSAMLPFLQDKIAARKLLIYTERDGEHPVNAAEVTNDTSKTLDGGPITVFDGGAYAGEALFETLKPNDKRLIGYAVDYGTRITTAFDSAQQRLREIHVANGTLRLRYSERQTRTYTIRNVDNKPKTLVVQQDGINEYSVLSPKPSERTATAYRFEVKLPANASQVLKVEQERTYANVSEIASATPDFLIDVVENRDLAEQGRKQLQTIVDLKRQIAETGEALNAGKSQISDLAEDQSRLRQNIDSLNRVHGQEEQVRRYSAQLADNETQIAKLRDRGRELTARESTLDSQLKSAIEALSF